MLIQGGVIQNIQRIHKKIARDVSAPKTNKDRELVLERINVFRKTITTSIYFMTTRLKKWLKVFKFDKYNSQFIYLVSNSLLIMSMNTFIEKEVVKKSPLFSIKARTL